MSESLLRAEDEGMGGGEHAHLHKVQAALAQLGKDLCSTATEVRLHVGRWHQSHGVAK